jgi:hypothetical protein
MNGSGFVYAHVIKSRGVFTSLETSSLGTRNGEYLSGLFTRTVTTRPISLRRLEYETGCTPLPHGGTRLGIDAQRAEITPNAFVRHAAQPPRDCELLG